ncbi:hypothetical protein [Methanobrevibacter sp. DSM 116169]|uniref:hypothetical protein n=1 Tax=Methanobrevibacter sp. DSM 116169 TaxID=3242727 RepID=UPI0038FBE72B
MVKISNYDIKLNHFIKRRNINKKTISHYNLVFTEIFKLFNKIPSELIDEFKHEQKPYITNDGFIEVMDMNDRKINKYQFIYDDYLKDKTYSNSFFFIKLNSSSLKAPD